MGEARIITLLTDFGQGEPFVGIMKGVILGRCREATVVDLTHQIPAFDILGASFLLQSAMPVFPPGSIHVAVVDPGVGGQRRPLVAEIGDQLLVAPDNGILTYPLAEQEGAIVREITAAEYFRHPVSTTFHGRDIFASVAGHLAAGLAPERLGPVIHDQARLPIPRVCTPEPGQLSGCILWVDRFGNCITNIRREDVEGLVRSGKQGGQLALNGEPVGPLVGCFADAGPGGCGCVIGSAGRLELFCNQGDFAGRRGLQAGMDVRLEMVADPAPRQPRGR